MVSFEGVADEYDAGRPSYPAKVYDALEPLAGAVVLEGGAGTGVATRDLLERGAVVVPFDVGPRLLRKALGHTKSLMAVVGDGGVLPFRDGCADLVCFAQAWHWLDERTRYGETFRVLRPRGRWAGWWSHARADAEEWFDEYWTLVERACPGTHRSQRDLDWGAGVKESGLFRVADRITVGWTRDISVGTWLTDQASHSYIASLPPRRRRAVLDELENLVVDQFPDGVMSVPYETWLWIAERI